MENVSEKPARKPRAPRKKQDVPTPAAPMQDALMQDALMQHAPTLEAPMQDALTQHAPTLEVPTLEAPEPAAPMQDAPKRAAPMQQPTKQAASKVQVLEDFQALGRDMFLTGLVSSHTGSLSVRQHNKMVISRRGVMLGRLKADDLIEIGIEGDPPEEAAEDAVVHQAVYRFTDAQAVIYAHPAWTTALALVEDRLSPASHDGADNLGSAPVLISQRTIDSPDIAQLIGRTLRESRVAALRGQGVFARGANLSDAFHMVSLLEEMCKVVQIYRTLSREERQPVGFEQRDRQPTNAFRPRNDNYGRRPPGGRPPQQRGPSGPPRQGDGGPPRRPYQPPRDPNGARRGPPPPRH